jgi:hypothetical protein
MQWRAARLDSSLWSNLRNTISGRQLRSVIILRLKLQNVTLRMTAQVFHSLGFYWARETGIYDIVLDDEASIDEAFATGEMIEERWKIWAAKETQLRAMLGKMPLLPRTRR